MAVNRRTFLHRAAAMIPAMHAGSLFAARGDEPTVKPPADARFARLVLHTAIDLDVMAKFYRDTLRLPVERTTDSLRVTAGETTIDFIKVEPREGVTSPYYHFAFNIPHNQLDLARQWLEPRCPLVKLGNGEFIADFTSWDAHAFYFLDPAGNILEFIARHSLKNDRDGEFSEKDILCASEIGVVAPDVATAADQLCDAAKLNRYRPGDENFAAVGDEQGLFIVVKTGRKWFSSERAAELFEAEAFVSEKRLTKQVTLNTCRFALSPA